ncbi:MAG TPA: glucosamine-6-phosphate deaminase [Mucilaginibacter sp.]|nr:glucosamine-6-phosphate deaminase [Mucilaginibacter sp.]
METETKTDNLVVRTYASRAEMGRAAAKEVTDKIKELLGRQKFVNIVFAAAPSQEEFLAELVFSKGIDWKRVNAFHMDEYIGLSPGAPQGFGEFLKKRIFSLLPFRSVNYIDGNAANLSGECERYSALLSRWPADLVCMGIGANGHIAFNDPHVADFDDPLMVKIVSLDRQCRRQQVNDGCFARLDAVPTHAITLTIPALMAGKYIYCMVPGKNKADAVYNTLMGEISEQCPASVLRRHAGATLFLDADSSSILSTEPKNNLL